MPVELIIDDDLQHSCVLEVAALQRIQRLAAEVSGQPQLLGEVCVRICSERVSRELNARYRGKDKPTNVLSFAADIDLPQCEMLGDLAICWPVVTQEAGQQGKSVERHFTHLLVHGLLHLIGMDHEDASDAERMESTEVLILARLGMPNPYEPCI